MQAANTMHSFVPLFAKTADFSDVIQHSVIKIDPKALRQTLTADTCDIRSGISKYITIVYGFCCHFGTLWYRKMSPLYVKTSFGCSCTLTTTHISL